MRFRRTNRSVRSWRMPAVMPAVMPLIWLGKPRFGGSRKLESSQPLTVFTRETLLATHAYLCGDVYPWAGTIRTSEVGAMGLAMCRAAYVDQELDRIFRRIEQSPPSATDREAALNTVAEHWGELTIIHPFLDGNSRTQRYFFRPHAAPRRVVARLAPDCSRRGACGPLCCRRNAGLFPACRRPPTGSLCQGGLPPAADRTGCRVVSPHDGVSAHPPARILPQTIFCGQTVG